MTTSTRKQQSLIALENNSFNGGSWLGTSSALNPDSSEPRHPDDEPTFSFLQHKYSRDILEPSLWNSILKLYVPGSKSQKRIEMCGHSKMLHQCPHCQNTKEILIHCFIRYHKGCFNSKVGRAKRRLGRYRRLFGSTCKHFTFTYPKCEFSIEQKNKVEHAFTKLLWHLRHKHGYRIFGVKILDFNIDNNLNVNFHVHFASNTHYTIPQNFLKQHWYNFTEQKAFDVHAVKSNTDAVFNYFAKRIAGKLGNESKGTDYFLDDVMDIETYDKLVRGSRTFSVSYPNNTANYLKAYLEYNAPNYFTKCSKCGSMMHLVGLNVAGVWIKSVQDCEIIYD